VKVARRIVHIITGLPTGGSQTMLAKLLSAMDSKAWVPTVISLRDEGAVGKKLASAGFAVRALGMREHPSDLLALARLARWLRELRPTIVQTWLYHADLFGGLVARWSGDCPVIWNIRQSDLDPNGNRRTTICIAHLCARLSRHIPARIICCSEASRRVHTALGYYAERMVVIPNGFDLQHFRPDPLARESVRRELGIAADTPLIGQLARFDPQKDHQTFIGAARLLVDFNPAVHFLLCGEGIDQANPELESWVAQSGLAERSHFLGPRTDIPRLMAALDVASLSSAYGEGFPNVLGEAMACGVPCVATDVGECAAIVGDAGRIVPRRDPPALAAAWRELIDAGANARRRLGEKARHRIETDFDLPRIAARYQGVYEQVAG
jgi:glycosyltransferase involved in cell wall biosynthesis